MHPIQHVLESIGIDYAFQCAFEVGPPAAALPFADPPHHVFQYKRPAESGGM